MKYILAITAFLFYFVNANAQCDGLGAGNNKNGNFTISGNCSITGNVTLEGSDLTITSTGTLTITGNLITDKNGTIDVDGNLIVTGDIDNSGNHNINISGGFVDVDGSFLNVGQGIITVNNGGQLDVGDFDAETGNFVNGSNGEIRFLDGDVNIAGDFSNSGNGDIQAGATVNVGGDFNITGNSDLNVSGGLSVGGTLDYNPSGGGAGITIEDGGVLFADEIISDNTITVDNGGTIAANNPLPTDIVFNPGPANDGDCTNNCCGENCNPAGDGLNDDALAILPVELIEFSTVNKPYSVDLNWSTASESNTSHFEIYKSSNGEDFFLAGKVDAVGNSSTNQYYSFPDKSPFSGYNFYKLKSVDFDGYTETFDVILNEFQFEGLQPYPNPFDGSQLNLSSFTEIGDLDVLITTIDGKIVYNGRLSDDEQLINIQPVLDKGIYFIKIRNEQRNYNYSTRILVR